MVRARKGPRTGEPVSAAKAAELVGVSTHTFHRFARLARVKTTRAGAVHVVYPDDIVRVRECLLAHYPGFTPGAFSKAGRPGKMQCPDPV